MCILVDALRRLLFKVGHQGVASLGTDSSSASPADRAQRPSYLDASYVLLEAVIEAMLTAVQLPGRAAIGGHLEIRYVGGTSRGLSQGSCWQGWQPRASRVLQGGKASSV